jgi:hypothetical protein
MQWRIRAPAPSRLWLYLAQKDQSAAHRSYCAAIRSSTYRAVRARSYLAGPVTFGDSRGLRTRSADRCRVDGWARDGVAIMFRSGIRKSARAGFEPAHTVPECVLRAPSTCGNADLSDLWGRMGGAGQRRGFRLEFIRCRQSTAGKDQFRKWRDRGTFGHARRAHQAQAAFLMCMLDPR